MTGRIPVAIMRNRMITTTPPDIPNHLIERLPHHEKESLIRNSTLADLVQGQTLCDPGKNFRDVYFPLTGFISQVFTLGRRRPLEMGIIGEDGMVGATLALGVTSAPMACHVRGSGQALRLGAAQLRKNLQDSPVLLNTLQLYLFVTIRQLALNNACNRFHGISPRLARWLLVIHDHVHLDDFHLTHQFLADMLGVQRSAVTIAAGTLQKRTIIDYSRGHIHILSRKGLEAASCSCYAASRDVYARLLN